MLCAGCLTGLYQLLHPRQQQWREESAEQGWEEQLRWKEGEVRYKQGDIVMTAEAS